MKRSILVLAIILVTMAATPDTFGQSQVQTRRIDQIKQDPIVLGEPLSYWLRVIHDRKTEELGLAYEAITELGPAASAAVPDLTQIVTEPFTPIRVGRDDKRAVLEKLKIIFIKGGALDSLGAIGIEAASSAPSVIEWSLTLRVLPPENGDADPIFIDLVAIDVLERMRGAGVLAQFGTDAAPAVQELMESGDAERRKFAVAILNEASLPIASDLMKSRSCHKRMLGLSVLADMWPVVASRYLDALSDILACSEDERGFSAKRTPTRTLD